jgi:peroxiredoxin Q/BCP
MSNTMSNIACPPFKTKTETGEEISNESLKGSFFVIYFYPKDDTPGCTIEANEFQKLLPEFEKLNCKVFGISKDSEKSHKAFKEKYCLKFPLLMDTDGKICADFDVIKEKSMFGKKYMGISRDTFLINPEGEIVFSWQNVKADLHAQEVLDKLKVLS